MEGLPTTFDIPMETFAVQAKAFSALQKYLASHQGGGGGGGIRGTHSPSR